MRSPRVVTSALTAVLALALVAAVPAPAFAAIPPTSDDGRGHQQSAWEQEEAARSTAEVASVGSISGQIVFRPAPGAPTQPVVGASVSIWHLNPETNRFETVAVPGGSVVNGNFTIGVPFVGDYAVQFTTDPYSGLGPQHYNGVRYFFQGTDVPVADGQAVNLGIIELTPRYFDAERLAGPDRFATAVEISKRFQRSDRAPVVYIANGYKFPDALAAGPAAIHSGGTFLPTAPDYLPSVVAEELARLQPLRVVIAGDENSVSDAVRQQITAAVGTDTVVERLGGATRYETAALIVRDAFEASGSYYAIVATGAKFPDALAAGPAAGRMGAPVLLVDGAGDLDASTRALIDDLGIGKVLIAGGTETVGSFVEADLVTKLGQPGVTRLDGTDRYRTASKINEWVFGNADIAVLANGYGFVDALAGGPFAGWIGAPLFLSDTTCVPYGSRDGILRQQVSGVFVLGSEATLGPRVMDVAVC